MTNLIATDFQGLEVDSPIITLFELTLPNDTLVFLHPGSDSAANSHGTIHFRNSVNPATINEYTPFPCALEGVEVNSDGAASRPSFQIANVGDLLRSHFGDIEFSELIGKKITRRQTLEKYLDNGSGNSANPPIELNRVTFVIDRIAQETGTALEFELAAASDLEGIRLPRRVVLGKYCSWMYQGHGIYSKGGCTWKVDSERRVFPQGGGSSNSHHFFFDVNDHPLVEKTWLNTSSNATQVANAAAAAALSVTPNTYVRIGNGGATTAPFTYWQSLFTGSGNEPSATSSYWKQVYPYEATWSNGTAYAAGTYIRHAVSVNSVSVDTIWKCIAPTSACQNQSPSYTSKHWVRAELCGKTLNSCKCRFQGTPVSYTSTDSAPSATKDTKNVLPFGSFPTAANLR